MRSARGFGLHNALDAIVSYEHISFLCMNMNNIWPIEMHNEENEATSGRIVSHEISTTVHNHKDSGNDIGISLRIVYVWTFSS